MIDSGLVGSTDFSGRGAARAEDAQGTPTQNHVSPSILVYEEKTRVEGLTLLRDNLFAVLSFEFRISVFGFRVQVSGFGFQVSVFKVSGFGFSVSGFEFQASGFGFKE